MAQFFYITEYDELGITSVGLAPRETEIRTQVLTVSGTATASAVFNKVTKFVRVCADTSCAMVFTMGAISAATATCMRLPANVVEYRAVPANSTTQFGVSVIGIQ